jgi:hypothetical protein
MKVRFSIIEEFLAELRLDTPVEDTSVGGVWDEHILRVTRTYEQTKQPIILHCHVLATCVIRDKIVELRQYCGQIWDVTDHEPPSNAETQTRAEALLAQLREAAEALGLEVRAGVYEP